jgi:hypothetical protein
MSLPAFVDFRDTPKLRLAVLKLMFPRGRVLQGGFVYTDRRFSMCTGPRAAGWRCHHAGGPMHTGPDLLSLIAFLFGTTQGIAAVQLLEAATGMKMTPHETDQIAAIVENNGAAK